MHDLYLHHFLGCCSVKHDFAGHVVSACDKWKPLLPTGNNGSQEGQFAAVHRNAKSNMSLLSAANGANPAEGKEDALA